MRSTHCSENLPETFNELNMLHSLRPIQDKVDFESAQEIADSLAVLDRRTGDQEDYLDTLATLMEKYENEHSPIDTSRIDPVGTLRFLMARHRLTGSDIGRLLGSRPLGGAILRGERGISKAAAVKLADHFGVEVGVFIKGAKSRSSSRR